MLRKIMLPAAALFAMAAIAGCSHEGEQARLDMQPEPAPIPTAMHVLAFSDDGANAKLASMDAGFGGPGLMLECEHGTRLVHLTRVGGDAASTTLALAADGLRSALAIRPQTFEGRSLSTAEASSDALALRGFRRTALLRVEDGPRSLTATTEDGREGAERFFAACEARV